MPEIANSAVRGILIDEVDLDLESDRWSLTSQGYARRGRIIAAGVQRVGPLHRVIGARMIGRPLAKLEEVDHINGNVLDNRRSNLRVATRSENMRNQQNRVPGVSGFTGVSFISGSSRYRAQLTLQYQQVLVGCFSDVDEAAWMRDQWAIALHGEYARLNFTYIEVEPQR